MNVFERWTSPKLAQLFVVLARWQQCFQLRFEFCDRFLLAIYNKSIVDVYRQCLVILDLSRT